jgi:hypothetical protein
MLFNGSIFIHHADNKTLKITVETTLFLISSTADLFTYNNVLCCGQFSVQIQS